jgi:hypothetical protein
MPKFCTLYLASHLPSTSHMLSVYLEHEFVQLVPEINIIHVVVSFFI